MAVPSGVVAVAAPCGGMVALILTAAMTGGGVMVALV